MNSTPNLEAAEADDVLPRALSQKPSRGRPALRGLVGLLLAACIFAAAFASQSPYSGVAKQTIARWGPQLVSTSSLPPNKSRLAAQPSPSAPQLVAAEPMRRSPSAQTVPQELGPTAAPLSPELEQRLQTMTSELASVEHEIEQLKTSQDQMARDNASVIEQFKASQDQMARDNANSGEQLKVTREQLVNFIAAVSKQNLEPKTAAPPSNARAQNHRSRRDRERSGQDF
jgi:uncharacterized protein YgiM (DUF1202 family)